MLVFNKISVYIVLILFSVGLSAQVGIGTNTPTKDLDVVGDIQITGALMPDGDPGIAGEMLISNGPLISPTWSFTELNSTETVAMGKKDVPVFNIPNTPSPYLILTIPDSDCRDNSTCTITWKVPPPIGVDYVDITVTAEAQLGQWKFHIANRTGGPVSNVQFSYFAFY